MCGQQLQLELLTSTLLCDSGEIRNDSCGFPYGCCYCDQDLQCYFSSNLKCYRLLLLYSSGNANCMSISWSTLFWLRTMVLDLEMLILILASSHSALNRISANWTTAELQFANKRPPKWRLFITWLSLDVLSLKTVSRIGKRDHHPQEDGPM